MDPYAINMRKHPHCSRERNDIHDTVIHELALMAERAGYPMDHECRYVDQRAAMESRSTSQMLYGGVYKYRKIVASEAGDNSAFNRDNQLTDEVEEFLLEGKVDTTFEQDLYTQCDDKLSGSKGRKEGIDRRAKQVRTELKRRFEKDHAEDVLNQFRIVPCCVGAFGETAGDLKNLITTLAMLVAIRESQETGCDRTHTQGVSIRYSRYLVLIQEFTLRIQIAVGIVHAQLSASVELRSRDIIGGAGIPDHIILANRGGAFQSTAEFRNRLLSRRRHNSMNLHRTAGPDQVPTQEEARAQQCLTLLADAEKMDKTKKPKKPSQCSSCKRAGCQTNWSSCPNFADYQRQRAERKREREERDAARSAHSNASGGGRPDQPAGRRRSSANI